MLCKIAWREPQAAYSGFIKVFKHKPISFMRTITNVKNQLKQLHDVIRTEFILAITREINCSDIERKLMSLPPRFWGLGIPVFSESAQKEYESKDLTILSKDLTTNVLRQQPQFATNNSAEKIKRRIKLTKMKHHNEELQKLRSTLAEEQKPLNEFKREQGLSKLHKKLTFPIRISSVNVTKSTGNCGFGHIYWRNP